MKDSSGQDAKGLLQDDYLPEVEDSLRSWPETWRGWRAYLNENRVSVLIISILGISNAVALLVVLYLVLAAQPSCDLPLNQPPQGVTPTLSHLARKPTPKWINITLFPDDSFFREHNSEEADRKWEEYDGSRDGFILIPQEEAEQAGINPARHAYVDRPDLGVVGYPVLPEAIHHMHCLSMIRQNLYYNINHTRQNCQPPYCETPELEEWRILHVDHCLETLRHRLECTADLGIVPFMWYQHRGRLTGDMARMHTCSEYGPIKDFLHEKGVLRDDTVGILKPPKGAFISDYTN